MPALGGPMSATKRPSRQGCAANLAPLSPQAVLEQLTAAVANQRAGDFEAAIPRYEEIAWRNPEVLEASYFLALIAIERGQLKTAVARLKSILAKRPTWFEARSSLAYALEQIGEWAQAVDIYRALLAANPDRTQVMFRLADALEVLGHIAEAVALLRDLAGRQGERMAALIALASLLPGALHPDEVEELGEAARAGGRASPPIGLYFALGELMEYQGRFDEAFAAFSEGNRLKRQALIDQTAPDEREMAAPESLTSSRPPDEAAGVQARAVGYLKSVFTTDFIALHEGRGHHLAAPIFVIGMARSGSTLVEQILSSHPKVQGLGESTALARVLAGRFPMNLFAPDTPDHFRHLADTYLRAMHDRGWKSAPRFVDKMLGNFMSVGVIHLMFPRATILHTVRDPVEVCLANFRKLFATGNEASYDLADIGRDYVRYREVMAHWARVLPDRVVDVSHEALVANPEGVIRWIVTETCGLSWDDTCLRFYKTKRPVRTASVAQVRRPIFASSIQRWRRYESHLGPLFDALGPYAPKGR
jgi:tetratricopeptide (TPR) repeat protein